MFLYNISVILEENLDNSIVSYIENELLSASNYPYHVLEMLDSPHPGNTFCIQFQVPTEESIDDIKANHVAELQSYIQQHYAEKIFLFDSVMKYLPRK